MKYDYRCTECNFVEEKSHGMNETPHYHCPDCGAAPMKKYYGKMDKTEGFVLRGCYWERDGYGGMQG